ncbi:MAG: MerR family DNA-binding protein [Acidiferrobacterales bacterium]
MPISHSLFIQRARAINLPLAETDYLLHLRERLQRLQAEVGHMGKEKLTQVESRQKSLHMLRNELCLLLNPRAGRDDGCPIPDTPDNNHRLWPRFMAAWIQCPMPRWGRQRWRA